MCIETFNNSHVLHKLLVRCVTLHHTQPSWERGLLDYNPIARHGVGDENCVSHTKGTTSHLFFAVTN